MSSTLRRFEILLPLRFNDGKSVPDELVGQTLVELRQQFNAISAETQVIRGHWQHEGEEFRDELTRVFVDVADTPESHAFFRGIQGTAKNALSATRHLDYDLSHRGDLRLGKPVMPNRLRDVAIEKNRLPGKPSPRLARRLIARDIKRKARRIELKNCLASGTSFPGNHALPSCSTQDH
jgi:hypothetical protein